MKRLIAVGLSCLLVAGVLAGMGLSATAAESPPVGTSEAEMLDLVKDKPDGLIVAVEAKEGKAVNFKQHGKSTSETSEVGVVRITTEKQVRDLFDDPNVGQLIAGPVVEDPELSGEIGGREVPAEEAAADPVMAGSIGGTFGTSGAGVAVAILDTGFDTGEGQLTANNKIVGEYCSVDNNSCPGGTSTASGPGASDWSYCEYPGDPQYPYTADRCYHGTAVAEIAAGYAPGQSYNGVANGANLILMRVGRVVSGSVVICGSCVTDALTWLWNNRNNFGVPVVAVNMSFGNGDFSTPCDGTSYNGGVYNTILGLLNGAGILPVAATGNGAATNSINGPACIPGVHSVGGSASGAMAANTNVNSRTSSLAPYDQSIRIAGVNNTFSGTSAAAPAVAGAIAAIVATPPLGSGSYNTAQLSSALRFTGPEIVDNRGGCVCWGIKDVHVYQAFQRLSEMVWIETGQTNLWNSFRMLDTRTGFGTDCCTGLTQVGAGSHVKDLDSVIGVSPSNVKAVLLNVTALNVTAANSYVSVGPGVLTNPNFSNIQTYAGMTPVSTMVWTPMDSNGTVSFFNYTGGVDIIVDVMGFLGSGTDTDITTPTRVIDTRSGSPIGGNQYRNFDLRGVGPIPSNATGVYGALTVTNNHPGSTNTWVSAKAADCCAPAISNVQVEFNRLRSNFVMIPFDDSGWNNGHMEIYNASGSVHVILDIVGWVTPGDIDVEPAVLGRAADSRPNHVAHNADAAWSTSVTCKSGTTNGGVILNVTLLSGSDGGYFSVYPNTGPTPPNTSTVNAYNGQVLDNAAVVPLGLSTYPIAQGAHWYNYGPNNTNDYLVDLMGCLSS